MNKEVFMEFLNMAIFLKVGINVHVESNELPMNEIIYNPYENLIEKKKYYDKAYDENMIHKNSSGIKVVSMEFSGKVAER